jgi:hypothetical protein
MRTSVALCVAMAVLLPGCDTKQPPPEQEHKDLSMNSLIAKKVAQEIAESQQKIDSLRMQAETASTETERTAIRQQIEQETRHQLELKDRAATGR